MELIPKTGTETQIVDQTALRLSPRQEPNQEGNAMALLVFAILDVMCCYFCYFVGTQKGYNGPLCAFAGLFGSFLACLIRDSRQRICKRGSPNWSTARRRQISRKRRSIWSKQRTSRSLRSASRFGSPPEHRTRSFVLAAGSGNREIGTAATPAGCHSTMRMSQGRNSSGSRYNKGFKKTAETI